MLRTDETHITNSSVTVGLCERSQDLTKNCLNIVLDPAPFDSWTHVCMTVDHSLVGNHSGALIRGYINGQLKMEGMEEVIR